MKGGRPCCSFYQCVSPDEKRAGDKDRWDLWGPTGATAGCHPITPLPNRSRQVPATCRSPCKVVSWSLGPRELLWRRPAPTSRLPLLSLSKDQPDFLACCTCSRNNVRLKKETPQRRPAPYLPLGLLADHSVSQSVSQVHHGSALPPACLHFHPSIVTDIVLAHAFVIHLSPSLHMWSCLCFCPCT